MDAGLYHFGDKREYEYFYKPRKILAELFITPENPKAGKSVDFTITLNEIIDGQKAGPPKDIGIYHDRILHALVVGEDLKTFAHLHPEDLGPITDQMREQAKFPLRFSFPKAGRYAINIDYVVSGREISESFYFVVEGDERMERPLELPRPAPVMAKKFAGYSVTFKAANIIKAREKVKLYYFVEKEGKPVTDLEPYLAAAMHISIVRQDLARFTHTHCEAHKFGSVRLQQLLGKHFKYHMHFTPDHFGPEIITQPWTTVFPTPGLYQVFAEFRHEGKTIVTDFPVLVE